ncbi:hypothetical protein LPJ38_28615 [Bradyrhizobium daqingense]|uniref:hypothetical protein n=1 Tax=Bradyrhizobium daqingense TaxID=993502 RepID=UPI0011A8C78C|nr:hypothetical protein [Bradyrhizobium daqingense]UFS87573.1 hypothetical protein LPJ38_28615 [Bradyrhizobium daqingense]
MIADVRGRRDVRRADSTPNTDSVIPKCETLGPHGGGFFRPLERPDRPFVDRPPCRDDARETAHRRAGSAHNGSGLAQRRDNGPILEIKVYLIRVKMRLKLAELPLRTHIGKAWRGRQTSISTGARSVF